jgi:CoA:oxalate CoA-transferase
MKNTDNVSKIVTNEVAGGALEGVRVLDLTIAYNGPFCTMNLADHGAEVIKIERPKTGDQTREWPPFKDGASGYYAFLNRNKKGLTLNLRSEKGNFIFRELVKTADVVVNNFKPGTMEKLGIGYDVLRDINPGIIYASSSGFGSYGPLSDRPAYDNIAQALGGMMSITGYPDGPPVKIGPAVGDNFTGTYLALAIAMALYRREKTGRGQQLEVAMTDTIISILEGAVIQYTLKGEMNGRVGNIDPYTAPFDMYECADGYIVIAAASQNLWEDLCRTIGKPELIDDPELLTTQLRVENYFSKLKPIFVEWTAGYTLEELQKILEAAGIPHAPVLDIEQMVNHANTEAREMVVEVEDPVLGPIRVPGVPIKMFGTPGSVAAPAPLLGQHNAEILASLGIEQEKIREFEEKGII